MTDSSIQESKLERTELISLLQNFSNLRTGQDQVLWSIIGAFWTANSVLLVSIFSADKEQTIYVGILISAIGISISWIWSRIQNSALLRIGSYESAIKNIEKKLNIEYDLCAFLRADSDEYSKSINKKSARFVIRKFSKYAIIFWTVALFVFTVLLIRDISTTKLVLFEQLFKLDKPTQYENMTNLKDWAELIALVTLIVTLTFAIYQIIQMKRATYATSFDIIMNILQTDKRREERKLVMEQLNNKPLDDWNGEEVLAAENVCQSYDTAGIMIRNKMLPTHIIADSWGNSIRTTWNILSPFVQKYRTIRGSNEYWDDYEWLAKQANKYHKPL